MEKVITKGHLDRSIDSLARMVKKGFDGMDKRFDENKKEHRQIFDRLDKIDMKLGGIEEALAIR